MPLHPVYGHERLRSRLGLAVSSRRLPQAVLFAGPTGIGKQRLALWLAQALLCPSRKGTGDPCGECQACRWVAGLAHPDLRWFVPLEPPKRSLDEDKKLEWVEEALGEVLAARRAGPLYERPEGMASHSLAAVRLLLRQVYLRPAAGPVKVFIVGDAERLVVQEASQEAANALLKALEEPPPDTFFVLTAADPEALLPTMRSRVVTLRVSRLADSVVTAFLQREMKPPLSQAEVRRRVAVAQGSIGRALTAEPHGAGADAAASAFEALERGSPARYEWALKQPPWSARGDFTALLDGMLATLREQARSQPTRATVRAMELVLEKRGLAQGNVNPQLLLARLLDELAEAGIR